jgi:cation-transporting ATPase F
MPPQTQRWHAIEVEDLPGILGVPVDLTAGLDAATAEQRLAEEGPNRLSEAAGAPWWRRLLEQFSAPLVVILLIAAAGAFLLGEIVDAAVILLVVLVNAAIGFLQEGKALRAIAALARSMRMQSSVCRDARWHRVDSEQLVRGDLVRLEPGDRVPADLRLVVARDFCLDESMLTGESLPVAKQVAAVAVEASLGDRASIAHGGSMVIRGRGVGVVVATGDRSEVGRIGTLVASAESIATPLTRKIAALSRILLVAILAVAVIAFAVGVLQGRPLGETFMAAVALAVGAIPEGLPAGVTIMLAVGVGRMAERRAIVRRLPAVEALGSTTVICSDKTGTLTENQMTVETIISGDDRYTLTGGGYDPAGEIQIGDRPVDLAKRPALRALLEAGVLCNDARHLHREAGWAIDGDPTEGALLVAARKGGLDPDSIAAERPRLDAVEFESERQFMATLHPAAGRAGHEIYLKGAVEVLLPRCDARLDAAGQRVPIDPVAVLAESAALGRSGLRVLALCRREQAPPAIGPQQREVASGLTFLGLSGMLDPPRGEARRAVLACRRAGIRVKMVTGDHAATAASIAAMLGIGDREGEAPLETLTGAEIAELSDEALSERIARVDVLARVSPEQKLRIVKALQAQGQIVAMTGDGVNDAPALRQADLGLAMGLSGTEAAKAAADIVLADDRFATIEAAVEEGRGVYQTLSRFVAWTLPTNGGEGLVIFGSILVGGTLPLLPVQALWINMSTSVLLGVPLVFERRDRDLMELPPRDPARPLLDFPLCMRIGLVSVLLWFAAAAAFHLELARGSGEAVARSAAASAIVVGKVFYLFSTRSGIRPFWTVPLLSNRWLLAGIAAMMAAQWAVISLGPLQRIMGTGTLDLAGWSSVILTGVVLTAVVEFEKWVRRRLGRGLEQPGS